jgi:hypothetical protein
MAMNLGNLDAGLVVGFIGGIVAFFHGLRSYRVARFLQDTPETPIRGISMGFVRIHGKAKSDQLVTSPVTHTPCCYYAVEILKWEKSRDGRITFIGSDEQRGGWMHYGAETGGGWFYLEDSTGRVLVSPYGANYALGMTGMREVGSARASSFASGGVSERELLAYVARVGRTPMIPGVVSTVEMSRAYRDLSEYMQHQTTGGELSEGMADPEMMNRLPEMQAKLRRMGLSPPVALPHLSPQSYDVAAPVPVPPAAAPPLAADPVSSSYSQLATGRYRLIECCILPDHEYEISGTCSENPGAKDSSDRNMIHKGQNERTYVISGQARSDSDVMLQRGSQWMIYGGGMVAVFCLGLLLLRFGFL